MDDKGQVVTFRLTLKELEELDAEARLAGLARSDYIRSRLLSPPIAPVTANLEALVRHLIYITTRTHIAVYSVAEEQGSLSTERLQGIYDAALAEGLKYINELPQRIAKAEAQLAAQTNSAPPTEK